MSLSRKSKAVFTATGLSTDLCRLVGEYLGSDLALLPKQNFYDIEIGGKSYIKFPNWNGYNFPVGTNLHLNEWIVKKRTPKSYVVAYSKTIVICENLKGITYKFSAHIPELDRVRRIFPFRRKLNTERILKDLSDRTYVVLNCDTKIVGSGKNFIIDFQR